MYYLYPGRWTEEEHALFVQLLRQEGRNWKAIADAIPSRTVIQIRTHAQKFFQKLEKVRMAALRGVSRVCVCHASDCVCVCVQSRDVEPDLMQFLDTSRMHRVSGSTRSDAAVKRRAGEAGTVLALELVRVLLCITM